jgi:peptidyl-prolyl cis-trans isomerase SurA
VDAVLNRLMESAGQSEYLVLEIFLEARTALDREEQGQLAERISQQLRNGAPFDSLARQFSAATSAAVGGNMGWVMADQVNQAMADQLAQMDVGQVSDPIETREGYYIVRLQDRRKVLGADPMDIRLTLKHITLPISQDATQQERDALVNRILAVTSRHDNCGDTASAAADLGTTSFGDVGQVTLRDLPANIRSGLQDLQVGEASEPFGTQNQYQVLIVCGREEPNVEPPSYQVVENSLIDQRLAMMSRRYLRDLRQDAIIDYR